MTPDSALLDAWRAGDASAGQQLFARHFEGVCRFFYNKVDDALEDLVQRTFLACLESRDRFRGDSAFFTYLIAIARNVLRTHYRERRADARIDLGSVSVFELTGSPSKVVAGRDDQRNVLEALRQIPADLQTALELHYWEEMSATDIALVLEIPQGTAKSRLRRAKEALRERLTARGQGAMGDAELDRCAQSVKELLPSAEPDA